MTSGPEFFEEKSRKIDDLIKLFARRSLFFSVMRFIIFVFSVASLIASIATKIPFFYSSLAVFLILFAVLCSVHGNVSAKLKYYETLKKVNDRYKARISGDFDSFFELVCEGLKRRDDREAAQRFASGMSFYTDGHDYCNDLDLFGKKSLFSLLNVSETSFGRRAFAKELLGYGDDVRPAEEILVRQRAVKELSDNPDFLEKYQATAMLGNMKKDPKVLIEFASEKRNVKKNKLVISILQICLWLIPLAALIFFPIYLRACVLGVLAFNLITWAFGIKANSNYFVAADGMPSQVSTIYKLYSLLETAGFKDEYLKKLISGKGGKTVTGSLSTLAKILFFAGLRSQPIFAFLFNSVIPLDRFVCYFMGKWADTYGDSLSTAVSDLAQIESLMCASQVSFVSEVHCFPEIENSTDADDNAYFEGTDITHPLLPPKTCVSNSVSIRSGIALITGSNMSGKTTLIRTVGVCSILAYTGAMVPGSSLKLGRMRVMSSMRITDNLGEDMSTFKAELVRISEIIKCAKESKTALLFLIDEIFRGTNSDDRTEGALIVLKNLSSARICGMMTTHDYAMIDKTIGTHDNIFYYHFSEKYSDTGITFDYKLADGISRESNARFLMKLVGIE